MIKAIILDVDGTLTDGKLYIGNDGEELKAFSIKDGLAIVGALENNINICIITGKISKIVEKRSQELGIKEIHQGISNKREKLDEICKKYNYSYNEIAYMGDDLNDYGIMEIVSYKGVPADGAEELFEIADFISKKNGGDGAVREFIKDIMSKQDLWKNVVNKYKG